jgi:hypothetical protein
VGGGLGAQQARIRIEIFGFFPHFSHVFAQEFEIHENLI